MQIERPHTASPTTGNPHLHALRYAPSASRQRGGPARAPRILLLALLLSSAGAAGVVGRTSAPGTPADPDRGPAAEHRMAHEGRQIEWGSLPPGFPAGAELAVVQGDPAANGAVFTIRLRMPNGYVLPPHFHPEDEHVTVVTGQFDVGLGTVVDHGSVAASLQRGGFITAPRGHNHWGVARGRTVVQVHGIGPFQTTFVDEQGLPLRQ